jgi:hypothetical protein
VRRALTLLAAVSLLVLGVACTDDDTPYQGSWVAPSGSLRALPGQFSPVSVQVKNLGTTAWKPGDVSVKPQELPDGWQGGVLKLTRQTKPGEVGTFLGNLSATAQVGLYSVSWALYGRGTEFGEALARQVEVTCSNGLFCDGEERFANGKCVAGTAPCDDGAACTEDVCDETARTCKSTPTGSCAVCMASCDPDCTGKECGDDGCGGQCGSCPSGLACAQAVAQCKPETQPGTCRSPLPLLATGEPLLGDHTIEGDTSQGLHQLVPSCNRTSTAVESVYTFTVTERVGMEARVSGYDTVLHLRKQRGADGAADCLDNTPSRTLACSDDSSPPGDYGSRISLALDPGTYFLIVDGFDSAQSGPFTLSVRFAAQGCVPKCDGLYCGGSDGCGGHCGVCASGESCTRGRCLPNPCFPSCDGKECGDDGCGGTCGSCPGQALCVSATGTCQTFAACDHLRPTCEPGCAATEFCGTDCQCHAVNEPQPDLILDVDRLRNEILFDTVFVTANSCARFEECVTGTGERRVLRFSVEAVNQGMATLTVPPPADRPDLFTFSPCHGHYHFSGFAAYELLDGEGKTVLTGRKQAYCMEDTQRVVSGPDVPCSKKYNCDEQGIQRGWSDLYGNTLDCQWLDITGVAPGDYRLQVTLNPARAFQEASLDNNTASVPVTIPPP